RSPMPVIDWPSNRTVPDVTRPGGGTSPTAASAVIDLPLPDSPTSPSVSPAAMLSDTSSTARRAPDRDGNSTVSPSMASSASSDQEFTVLSEHAAQRVGDFAQRRPGFDGGDDRRHQVRVAARGCGHRAGRRAPGVGAARRAAARHPCGLACGGARVALEQGTRRLVVGGVVVEAAALRAAGVDGLLRFVCGILGLALDEALFDGAERASRAI